MKTPYSILVLLILTAVCRAETWGGNASITFDGTSTLHDWGGKVKASAFKAEVTMEGDKPKRVKSTVTVKAASMDTAEADRDANMYKAMQVTTHPLIVGKIDAQFTEIAPASSPAKLPIELSLLGKAQSVTGTISNWKLAGDTATFDLDFDLSLKTSGIKVPAVLLIIRVGDAIKVHAAVTLKRSKN